MPALKLLTDLHHNGQQYPRGQVIDTDRVGIDAAQLDSLLDWRAVEVVAEAEAEAEAAPKAPKKPKAAEAAAEQPADPAEAA